MPRLESLAFPNATVVLMDMLGDIAPTFPGVPPGFAPETDSIIVVRRTGGGLDEDEVTDLPIMQIQHYAPNYLAASDLAAQTQVRILTSPLTMVGPVLIDFAELRVGEQEVPDVYPDDRRIVSTYQLGWRRPFTP